MRALYTQHRIAKGVEMDRFGQVHGKPMRLRSRLALGDVAAANHPHRL
jgi:hypothetical protein